MGTAAKYLARLLGALLLPALLAACQTDEAGGGPMSFVPDASANQPYPSDYKGEMLAFLRTYLNNPVGVREAAIAEPVQRTVGGRVRYVSCLKFAEHLPDGTYRDVRERAILFVNGRLDRIIPNPGDECAGAVYLPFPEMEKMQR